MYIARLKEQGHYSSARSYQNALNSLLRFCGQEAIPYTHVNRGTLLRYQDYLRDRECSWNTMSTYIRRIRRVYGLAIENEETPFSHCLFKGIFMGAKNKQKKVSPIGSLHLLMIVPLGDSGLRKTQQALCLMFLFCGMAFVDFTYLKKNDIRNGVLRYNRQKAGTPMLAETQPVAKELLATLITDTLRDPPYPFTFLDGMKTGEEALREYTSALVDFNSSLKELTNARGATEMVTPYSTRHSFAAVLEEQDVPIEMISELLEH